MSREHFGIHSLFLGGAVTSAPSRAPGAEGWPGSVRVQSFSQLLLFLDLFLFDNKL